MGVSRASWGKRSGFRPLSAVLLERIKWVLVFRRTEIDVALETAIDAVFDLGPTANGRRIIKLP
jgi:hypothetical protein